MFNESQAGRGFQSQKRFKILTDKEGVRWQLKDSGKVIYLSAWFDDNTTDKEFEETIAYLRANRSRLLENAARLTVQIQHLPAHEQEAALQNLLSS